MEDKLNITIDLANLEDAERKQLISLVRKAKKPKNNIWKPSPLEVYYFIHSNTDIAQSANNIMNVDTDRFSIGNYFRTKEEAEFAIERLKVMEELRVLSNAHNPTREKKCWCHITYTAKDDRIKVEGMFDGYVISPICFETIPQAEEAIEKIGKDRLKKYYFMVE